MSHENIKSHEERGLYPSLENTVLKKAQRLGGQIDPPVFLGLRDAFFKEFLWIAPCKSICFKFCTDVVHLF